LKNRDSANTLRAIVVAVALVGVTTPIEAQPTAIDTILARAGSYVTDFIDRFANVVAEERYLQESFSTRTTRAGSRRDLRSDLLLVRVPDSTLMIPFRDVFEVDGSPVRDREQRLAKLFIQNTAAAMDQAKQIAAEGTRYNLDSNAVKRTINNPLVALAFLEPQNQQRFRYQLGRRDAAFDPGVWVIQYREQSRPTFVRGLSDKDMPARGRYWIDGRTGRVVKTEVVLEDPVISATLTTDFQTDDRFQIDVPVQMRERYRLTNGREVSGVATYGRFRRFDVSTDEAIGHPRQ
jgi:hypothetical protein